ncbi:MAG: hypothetical protein GTO40_27590 [Deltaproteobacteria bacterium]|nr:hypothetical protein [Deltaproteobacteria bacterium]
MFSMGFKFLLVLLWSHLQFSIHPPIVHSHDGGLDSYGCHDHNERNDYHCHWGRFRGRRFSSRSEMLGNLSSDKQRRENATRYRTVKRVVSGDTLLLDNHETVQLIGIDAPEFGHRNKPAEHYGREAFTFTRSMAEGKRVRIELDQANSRAGHKDRYQRTLAYVFLENGTFLNLEMIRQGYGFVDLRSPFKYQNEFRRHQQEARGRGKGLWGKMTASLPRLEDRRATTQFRNRSLKPPLFVLGIYRTRHATHVYSQPREYSNIVTELEKGTTVNVVDIQGEWLMIKSKHGKTPGFIKKKALVP